MRIIDHDYGRTQVQFYYTGKLPWLQLVEVRFGYGAVAEIRVSDLACQVEAHQFFIRGMEAKPRRKIIVLRSVLRRS